MGRPTDPNRGFYHPPESILVENKRTNTQKGPSASVVSIPAHSTYDIWAYGVVLYEALGGLPLAPYACRGKRAMSASEVCKIGLWDEDSLKRALRHIPENGLARDLLKRVLHHDPSKRLNSMRHVLEHPFFNSGSVGGNGQDDLPSPTNTMTSTTSHPSAANGRHSNNGPRSNGSLPPNRFNQFADLPDVKQTNSSESLENRENGVRRSNKDDSQSTAGESVVSGRSFGGFRKLRNFRNTSAS